MMKRNELADDASDNIKAPIQIQADNVELDNLLQDMIERIEGERTNKKSHNVKSLNLDEENDENSLNLNDENDEKSLNLNDENDERNDNDNRRKCIKKNRGKNYELKSKSRGKNNDRRQKMKIDLNQTGDRVNLNWKIKDSKISNDAAEKLIAKLSILISALERKSKSDQGLFNDL